MGKIIIFSLLIVFLVLQITPSLHAESCISKLEVEVGIYEVHYNPKLYERSSYQFGADDRFVRENDLLIIERVSAEAGSSCQETETIIVQLKRPNSEEWGEDISIHLNFNERKKYSFELINKPKFNSIVYMEMDGNQLNRQLSKTLSNEGLWKIRVVDNREKNKSIRDSIINNNLILSGEFLVMGRLEVTQLEALRQLKEDSKKSSRNSLFMVAIIGIATILFMYIFHRREEERIIKTEEEKQKDLLETLLSELNLLKKNLKKYQEAFSKEKDPRTYSLYELWDIDISLYFKELGYKINNKRTISLKENLMFIKDKLLVINNLVLDAKEKGTDKRVNLMTGLLKINRENIVKIISEEILPAIEKSKKLVKKFRIK